MKPYMDHGVDAIELVLELLALSVFPLPLVHVVGSLGLELYQALS